MFANLLLVVAVVVGIDVTVTVAAVVWLGDGLSERNSTISQMHHWFSVCDLRDRIRDEGHVRNRGRDRRVRSRGRAASEANRE